MPADELRPGGLAGDHLGRRPPRRFSGEREGGQQQAEPLLVEDACVARQEHNDLVLGMPFDLFGDLQERLGDIDSVDLIVGQQESLAGLLTRIETAVVEHLD